MKTSTNKHDQILTKLTIKGMQSHENTVLHFTPGLNAIVGPSRSGKSTIIRALRLLIKNRPRRHKFIRDKHKKLHIRADFADGVRVIREKGGPGLNRYLLGKTAFDAVRFDVPEEVSEALRLTDVNIQTQHKPYFLLQDKPSKVASTFNEVLGLKEGVTILQSINDDILAFTKQKNIQNEQATIAKKQLLELRKISKFKTRLSELLKSSVLINEWTDLINSTNDHLVSIKHIDDQISQIQDVGPYKQRIARLQNGIKALNNTTDRIAKTESLLELESECSVTIDKLDENIINLTKHKNAILTKLKKCPTCGTILKKNL